MAKFIKTIVDRIQLLNRKGLCPYYSPAQICDEVHAESMNLWKKYIKEFEITELMSVYMRPFEEKEDVSLTSGVGYMSTSYDQYTIGYAIAATGVPVKLINIANWYNAINHSVRVPSALYPIAVIQKEEITLRPTSVTSVRIHYIKKPIKPVYAYNVSGDDYVYDDNISVDFEWPEILHDEIIMRVLGNLGVSQKQQELVQVSNFEKQSEGR